VFTQKRSQLTACAFDADHTFVVSGDADGVIRVYNIKKNEIIFTWPLSEEKANQSSSDSTVTTVALTWSIDNNKCVSKILAGTADGTIHILQFEENLPLNFVPSSYSSENLLNTLIPAPVTPITPVSPLVNNGNTSTTTSPLHSSSNLSLNNRQNSSSNHVSGTNPNESMKKNVISNLEFQFLGSTVSHQKIESKFAKNPRLIVVVNDEGEELNLNKSISSDQKNLYMVVVFENVIRRYNVRTKEKQKKVTFNDKLISKAWIVNSDAVGSDIKREMNSLIVQNGNTDVLTSYSLPSLEIIPELDKNVLLHHSGLKSLITKNGRIMTVTPRGDFQRNSVSHNALLIDWSKCTDPSKELLAKRFKENKGMLNKFIGFFDSDAGKQLAELFNNSILTDPNE